MLHPAVFNTSELCYHLGVRHAVMSPGSRNAPLTISFARNDKIKKWVIPDERSAGFIALGIAQETNEPVVLCCTSGTALLNYGPAIAEAYYREIPLIVLSADRPQDLIDQRDGQTIRQFEALRNHVKRSEQLPLMESDSNENDYYDPIIGSIQNACLHPKGPVHINFPFKEPFYPTENQSLAYSRKEAFGILTPIRTDINSEPSELDISGFQKVLILVGQQPPNEALSKELMRFKDQFVILKSPLNNLTCEGIEHADLFIKNEVKFQPELLITTGLSVLSKTVKQFIKNFPPKAHWHFDPGGVAVDTFKSSPVLIKDSLVNYLRKTEPLKKINSDFVAAWNDANKEAKKVINQFTGDIKYSEAHVMFDILKSLPENTSLHLGNSMPVRYAEFFGINKETPSWCNRGTSGIDGISSTAVGSSLVSDKLNLLISGDISFFYDRNAFFHNYKLPNLRIIVINNKGGGIFRLIDGPSKQPELEMYFETRHTRTCEWVCQENEFMYHAIHSSQELRYALDEFYESSENVKLMEIFLEPEENEKAYRLLRSLMK